MPSPDCKYTDVIIIGNGPSAISLSFYLSGHWPYYNGNTHSNIYLNEKLKAMDRKQSIVEQDLSYMCEGVEGRSSNPVAVLYDALARPDADLGVDNPPLIEWKYEKEHAISHMVLGKGKPGGAWQKMDGCMQTLSFGNWMELPSLPFKDWHHKRQETIQGSYTVRASISDVRNYYTDFVKERHLHSHFQDNHVVTSVQKVFKSNKCVDLESGEVEPCNCRNMAKNHTFLWEVRGYIEKEDSLDAHTEESMKEEFCYMAPHVVVATGTFDIANTLNVTGENLPYVHHSLQDFEKALTENENIKTAEPVVIVGAGLSAADAIIMALGAKRPVIHVFRRGANDSGLIFKKLPAAIYPEYHRIYSLMKGKEKDPLYKPYSKHCLHELKEDKNVLLRTSSAEILSFDVMCVVILIGARPDLSFLPNDGKSLGVVPKFAIDSKHNPFNVDPYSYQSLKEQGLFAMGPLVGDNFVRFGVGGSLGIMNYLTMLQNKNVA